MRRLLLAILLLLPATAAAQRATRDWPPEDRAVIGDFSVVTSVAATFDRVYATSRSMLVIWRPLERRWEGPFDPGDPGALERVFLAAADPLDQSVWMLRPDGWLHYQPDARTWERGVIPGQARELVFDETDQGGGPYYSGKKKIHSEKNIVIATVKKKRVSYLSQTYPGKTHDKKVAETENITYPERMTLLKDTGFQGYEPKVYKTVQPKKSHGRKN